MLYRSPLSCFYTTPCASKNQPFLVRFSPSMMRHMHTNIDTSATGRTTGDGVGDRYNIPDAAKVLGLSEEAVRQRVKRGTLNSIKVDGKLYILLGPAATTDTSGDQGQPFNDTSNDTSRLVDTLESEITHLRRQLEQANERDRENRRIIAALTQRIPELEPAREAPSEPRESPTTPSEEQGNGEPPEQEKRSWW